MKHLLAIGLGLALSASAFAGSPYWTTNLTTGITYVGAAGTSNAAPTAGIALLNNEEVGVSISCRLGAADTTTPTNIFVFYTSPNRYSTNYSSKHTISLVANGTTTVNTNFNVYVGSQGYFGLASIFTGSTNYQTNPVVTLSIKENRHGQ